VIQSVMLASNPYVHDISTCAPTGRSPLIRTLTVPAGASSSKPKLFGYVLCPLQPLRVNPNSPHLLLLVHTPLKCSPLNSHEDFTDEQRVTQQCVRRMCAGATGGLLAAAASTLHTPRHTPRSRSRTTAALSSAVDQDNPIINVFLGTANPSVLTTPQRLPPPTTAPTTTTSSRAGTAVAVGAYGGSGSVLGGGGEADREVMRLREELAREREAKERSTAEMSRQLSELQAQLAASGGAEASRRQSGVSGNMTREMHSLQALLSHREEELNQLKTIAAEASARTAELEAELRHRETAFQTPHRTPSSSNGTRFPPQPTTATPLSEPFTEERGVRRVDFTSACRSAPPPVEPPHKYAFRIL